MTCQSFVDCNIQCVLLSHVGSCDKYTNITEPWRNILFTSSSFPGYPKNTDGALVGKWWRFTGIGGDRITASCYGSSTGGGSYPIHITFSYPTSESLSATTGTIYGDYGSCSTYSSSLSLVLCPGGFHVFQPLGHPHSSTVFVTCKEHFFLCFILIYLFIHSFIFIHWRESFFLNHFSHWYNFCYNLYLVHHECKTDSCGPLAECSSSGGCSCITGYEIPPEHLPTPDSYGCVGKYILLTMCSACNCLTLGWYMHARTVHLNFRSVTSLGRHRWMHKEYGNMWV